MSKELIILIEADKCFCGDKCEYSDYNGMCMLFNLERRKNTSLKTLGQFYRIELCRRLSGDA
jgi:hypothetical protein